MEYKYIGRTFNNDWFIVLNNSITSDASIAKFLGISKEEYINILKQFNGVMKESPIADYGLFFDYKEDCQNAIKYLYEVTDSYLILKELGVK